MTAYTPAMAAVSPKEQLKDTIDKIIAVLKDPNYQGDAAKEKRRAILRDIIKERFDFLSMTVFSLGKYRSKFTPEQIQQIAEINGQILEETYVDRLEAYTDEEVRFKREKIHPNGKQAAIQTEIVTGSEPIPITYGLRLNKNGEWMVEKIKIVELSWTANKRSEWAPTLRKASFEEFLDKLKAVLDRVKTQPSE